MDDHRDCGGVWGRRRVNKQTKGRARIALKTLGSFFFLSRFSCVLCVSQVPSVVAVVVVFGARNAHSLLLCVVLFVGAFVVVVAVVGWGRAGLHASESQLSTPPKKLYPTTYTSINQSIVASCHPVMWPLLLSVFLGLLHMI